MTIQLPAQIRTLLTDERVKILLRCLGESADLHLVGGCVRDALQGRMVKDIDLCSALPPDVLSAQLEKAGIQVIPTGLQHQTVTTVPIEGEPAIEITTFRGPHMDPKGGVVQGSSIEEDLIYRDFTINAMAVSLNSPRLLDPCQGQTDIENRLIRCVASPEQRFAEDPLRVLRLIRFACVLEFAIDPASAQAAKAFREALSQVAIERVRDEFNKILVSPQAVRGIQLLQEYGFLQVFAPEISAMFKFEQNRFHHLDLFDHTMEVVRNSPPDLLLRLAAILHDIGKVPTVSINEKTGDRNFYLHEKVGAEMAKDLLERLKYPSQLNQDVCTLVKTHMRPLTAGAGGLRRLLRDTGELYPQWRILKQADATACKLDEEKLLVELAEFDVAIEQVMQGPDVSPLKNLAIGGQELIDLGMEPGPLFGEILRALHELVLDDPELNTKETLLGLVPEVRAKLAPEAEVAP